MRKVLRKPIDLIVFKKKPKKETLFNQWLNEKGLFSLDSKLCWDIVGNLTDDEQKQLANLVIGYVWGYTVTVFNEREFLKAALKAFKMMEHKIDQDEFDRLIRANA